MINFKRKTSKHPLLEMLSFCRPMGSKAERQFRKRYLLNLPDAWQDIFGNIHVEVGKGSRCLWSSHTDTVHRESGRQNVQYYDGFAFLPKKSKSSCLGADDTVGVYLMREMILAGVTGYYIFHYGEERGGQGSSDLAKSYGAEWMAQKFDYAIALDRKGESDIITHQNGRCCSDEFARALGVALGSEDHRFKYAGTRGVYTDTAEYVDFIPECTNLSVGYDWQHSTEEFVHLEHVDRLLPVLCALDTSALPVVRDPDVDDFDDFDDLRSYGWLMRDYPQYFKDEKPTTTKKGADPAAEEKAREDDPFYVNEDPYRQPYGDWYIPKEKR